MPPKKRPAEKAQLDRLDTEAKRTTELLKIDPELNGVRLPSRLAACTIEDDRLRALLTSMPDIWSQGLLSVPKEESGNPLRCKVCGTKPNGSYYVADVAHMIKTDHWRRVKNWFHSDHTPFRNALIKHVDPTLDRGKLADQRDDRETLEAYMQGLKIPTPEERHELLKRLDQQASKRRRSASRSLSI